MTKSQNLSTGPTSEEGKAISCQNSTKHGLTSVKLNTQEEQSLYDAMVASLTEELNPQGMTEVNLVGDMAMIRIRLNRFDKAEKALERKAKLHNIGELSGHSFRVGAAVDLLDKGVPLERIMLRGGWKSENTALRF